MISTEWINEHSFIYPIIGEENEVPPGEGCAVGQQCSRGQVWGSTLYVPWYPSWHTEYESWEWTSKSRKHSKRLILLYKPPEVALAVDISCFQLSYEHSLGMFWDICWNVMFLLERELFLYISHTESLSFPGGDLVLFTLSILLGTRPVAQCPTS